MSNQLKRVGFSSTSGGSSGPVKSSVSNESALPSSGNTVGDLRYSIAEEQFFRWTGSAWVTNSNYSDTFIEADWSLDSGEYWLEYLQATHLKGDSPVVQVLELVSGEYYSVIVTIEITNAGLVRIRVPSSPDLRFSGKIIIA